MSEIWDNPLFPLDERLEMAKGGVIFRDKVIENLRGQLEAAKRDAERLDFLIKQQSLVAENQWSTQNAFHIGYHGYRDGCFKWNPVGPGANTPREAIDAAIEELKKTEK